MLNFYQHLPFHINPIVFRIGGFSVHWYSLMYLLAFLTNYLLLIYRIKKKEGDYNASFILDLLLYSIAGLLIGGRLGYVLFYNLHYYLSHPLAIVFPIQVSGYDLRVTGLYGMSFFGGVIGIVVTGIVFTKKHKISFWKLADFVVPAIPAGYFFGRIGNFLNGELYGRVTQKIWGMYFPADLSAFLRHPSQLYEAFFEGLVIFVILWTIRNKSKFSGQLLLIYLLLYGFFRFCLEFFREPDPQIGLIFNFLTLGQIFSILFVSAAIIFLYNNKKQSNS
jgi:phosphatidylglycerol---prolipoprotein diacylglyceryl transferase